MPKQPLFYFCWIWAPHLTLLTRKSSWVFYLLKSKLEVMHWNGFTHICLVGHNESGLEMHSLMKSFWSLASHREVFLALFYLIYTFGLYANVEELGFNIKGFADDHQVYASFTPEFQYIVCWVETWIMLWTSWTGWISFSWSSLKLNPEKSQIIVFGSPEVLNNIEINGTFLDNKCIRFVSNVKNLGFYLDNTLSCDY